MFASIEDTTTLPAQVTTQSSATADPFIETTTTPPTLVTTFLNGESSYPFIEVLPPPSTSSLQSEESSTPSVDASASKQNHLTLFIHTNATQSSSPTSPPSSSTPPKPPSSQSPSHSTTILASSVAPPHTPATIPPSSNPIPPSPGSAGLSSAAKVGIGLGIPFGILLSAAIIYLSIRHHRHRTVRGTRATELHAADTAEKVTEGQSRDDGVVRELYWGAGPG